MGAIVVLCDDEERKKNDVIFITIVYVTLWLNGLDDEKCIFAGSRCT